MKAKTLYLIVIVFVNLFISCSDNDKYSNAFRIVQLTSDSEIYPREGGVKEYEATAQFDCICSVSVNGQVVEHDQTKKEFQNNDLRYKITDRKVEVELYPNITGEEKEIRLAFRKHDYFQSITLKQQK